VKEILIELTKSETKHRDEKISGIPQKTKKKANSQKKVLQSEKYYSGNLTKPINRIRVNML
jgi:hypothetical protein